MCIPINAYALEQGDCLFSSAALSICVSLRWLGLLSALQGQHVHELNYSLLCTFDV